MCATCSACQVEMIFADHDQECVSCARHGNCELQDLGEAVGLTRNPFHTPPSSLGG